jgi:acetylornithine deacetylase
MIERLVAFDTTSRDSNLDLIHFVAGYLEGHGVASTLLHNAERTKANLYATIGPADRGGVVLSGHTDVVPVDGQDWHTDPFKVVARDGRLYGRGTADMKSFSAVILALLPEFLGARLKTPVHLALSYDEEIGGLGAPDIVAHFQKHGPRPELVIVGEPTEMQVVDAHKSILAIDTTVTGLEAHSSATDLGVNAIAAAAELIGLLERLGEELKATTDPTAHRFSPPYGTISVGLIEGGTARNIIPRHCCFKWDLRMLPDASSDALLTRFTERAEREVLPKLRKVYPGAEIVSRKIATMAALRPEPGSRAEVLALALAGSNRTQAVSYGTEAGLFQAAGVPTIVCGPGNIREAHKPNEFIELTQVEACVGFMRRLIARLS